MSASSDILTTCGMRSTLLRAGRIKRAKKRSTPCSAVKACRRSRSGRRLKAVIPKKGSRTPSAGFWRRSGWTRNMPPGKSSGSSADICPEKAFDMRRSAGRLRHLTSRFNRIFKTFTKNLTRMLDRVVKTV